MFKTSEIVTSESIDMQIKILYIEKIFFVRCPQKTCFRSTGGGGGGTLTATNSFFLLTPSFILYGILVNYIIP